MCGRYSFYVDDMDKFYEEFEITNSLSSNYNNYNIAPTQEAPIITVQSPKKVHLARFGLIPVWSKDGKMQFSTINARSEDVESKPTYRGSLKHNRCLIPSSNYFEWKRDGDRKRPFLIKLPDRKYFAFAGLWSEWEDPKTKVKTKSFSILTCGPNKLMDKIHNRMPCILEKDEEDEWVNPDETEFSKVKHLLRPYKGKMDAYEVSTLVNTPKNNFPEILKAFKRSNDQQSLI